MSYPTIIIHFDFKVNEVERQIADVFIKSLQDAITINQNDDAKLAWLENEAQQAYARAVNLRNALRFKDWPKTDNDTMPRAAVC